MLAALLATSLLAPQTIEIYKGGGLAGDPLRYWDVADTTIESRAPDEPGGGYHTLSAGPGKTILIRFGDLRRAIGGRRRIAAASLVLSHSSQERAPLRMVARILAPWGEGPMRTLASLGPRLESEKRAPIRGAATWRHRRSGEGGVAWQQVGATGPADSKMLASVKAVQGEVEVTIEGLAAAVQLMVDRPYENHGLAILFDGSVEFFSSQNRGNRPRLVLQVDDEAPAGGPDLAVTLIEQRPEGGEASYSARVKNVGTAPSEPFSATWWVKERSRATFDVPKTLAPGEETVITTTKPYRPEPRDHRLQTVELRIAPKGPDADPGNDSLLIYEDARAVRVDGGPGIENWAQRQVELFNDTYLAHSRFSFAPEGALERVRIASFNAGSADATVAARPGAGPEFQRDLALSLGLPDLRREFGSQMPGGRRPYPTDAGLLGGETRFDGMIPGQITLPADGSFSPVLEALSIEETDMLSMTAVAMLNELVGKPLAARSELAYRMPSTVLIRATDFLGNGVANAEMSFFQAAGWIVPDGTPAFTVATSDAGIAVLPKRDAGGGPANPFGALTPDGGNGAFQVKATVNGVSEWAWLHRWQLQDAYSRGNPAAAIVDLRFNMPTAALDLASNLARDRIVTDSAGSPPTKLAALVDGSGAAAVGLPAKAGDWIDIDLGRDRALGEVRLVSLDGSFYEQFEIRLYGTGQRPDEGQLWTRERSFSRAWRARSDAEAGGGRSVAYRGRADRMRFIRIINRQDATRASLAEVRVAAVRLPGG